MITDSPAAQAFRACRAVRRCVSHRRLASLALALVVTALVGGCSSDGKSAAPATKTASTVVGQASTTVAQAPATNAPSNGGGSSGAPATTSPPSGPAPAITTFVTPDSIDCHNTDSPLFSASWTTTDAVKVTIAIDGPGIYKTYPANGSDSLPFNCSSSHTFLLTAYGQDGRTATKTITLQPRNVRPPEPSTT